MKEVRYPRRVEELVGLDETEAAGEEARDAMDGDDEVLTMTEIIGLGGEHVLVEGRCLC